VPGAGHNTITIDYTNGNPLPAAGMTLSGSGDDTVSVVGTAAAGTYTLNGGKFTVVSANPANTANLSLSVGGVVDVGSTLRLANVTVADGATLNVAPSASPGGKVLITDGLVLTGAAKVDLFNNGLVVGYGATSVLPAVQSEVVRGYNATGSAWGGAGITSSTAAANSSAAVGYAEAAETLGITAPATGTFLGQTVNAASVLVRYTLVGDATLNGVVDFGDLVRLAQNYNVTTGRTWSQGDFTYNGGTDFADLVGLAQNYNASLGPVAAAIGGVVSFSTAFEEAKAVAVSEPVGTAGKGVLRAATEKPRPVAAAARKPPIRIGSPIRSARERKPGLR
jgi:hypothetical protein